MKEKQAPSPRAKATSAKTKARKSTSIASSPAIEKHPEEEIARVAYALWESRGRPIGTPDEDWYRAKEQLTTDYPLPG